MSSFRSRAAFAAVTSAVVGMLFGWGIAYQRSVGGLGGALGASLLIAILLGLVALIAGSVLVATKIRHGDLGQAIRVVLATAGVLAAGAVAGGAAAVGFNGTYHAPVVQQSGGSIAVDLSSTSLVFVPRTDGGAMCTSEDDGPAVARVNALDLGELGPGTLRATLHVGNVRSEVTAELWIDGADIPEGGTQPFWRGPLRVIREETEGASGQGEFAFTLPGGSPWPSTLTGSISWTCRPWVAGV